MTKLEEAELTERQGRALSGHKAALHQPQLAERLINMRGGRLQ